MRIGKRLALDVGKARIGVAVCDRDGILASPLDAVARMESLSDTVATLIALTHEHEVFEIYVGEPLSLSGQDTASTHDSRLVATEIAAVTSVPVRLVDERFTTSVAASKLRSAGHNARSSKSIIDSASAVEILESALSFEKTSGVAPGELVGDSVGA